ncbi:MAG TPA: endonuclease/exonuclease/phosphatase family protein [Candidatus Peribacterales bacterium]|nr:endonuclease/exonuclease/phosphatase family protein [Candidatus Peribacterales bacterium]
MPQGETTRILFYNVGYCTGMRGSLADYAMHCLRYVYTPKRVIADVLTMIDRMVDEVQPDLCCFVEVRRVKRFIQRLWEYPVHTFRNKYGRNSMLGHLPYFRGNLSGYFARKDFPFSAHYLRHGAKKLVYEVRLTEEISLLVAHLSLRRKTRASQLKEIRDIISCRRHVILCGDFNIFNGVDELTDIIVSCRLKIINTLHDLTFPSAHPTRALDLFLCSEDLPIEDLEVLPVLASDHLPILLTLRV